MGSESMTRVCATSTDRTLAERSALIRHHNDQARQFARASTVYFTRGVVALGKQGVIAALRAVRQFDAFNADNDPYHEHDMGVLTLGDERLFWKIDYYDLDHRYASPDPTDPEVTSRVLTIMLASEY